MPTGVDDDDVSRIVTVGVATNAPQTSIKFVAVSPCNDSRVGSVVSVVDCFVVSDDVDVDRNSVVGATVGECKGVN